MNDFANPYEVLGVEPSASDVEIKRAFHQKARQFHPDREGGDAQKMAEVNRAWAILSDPEAKARFDRTGSTKKNSVDERARDTILGMLKTILRAANVDAPIISLLRTSLVNQRLGCQKARRDTQSQIGGLKSRLKRFRGPPGNFIEGMILSEIARGEAQLPVYDADEEVLVRASEMLGEFEDLTPTSSMQWLLGFQNALGPENPFLPDGLLGGATGSS